MVRIAVVGASGRMGLCLIRAAALADRAALAIAVSRAGSDAVGKDAGELAGIGTLGVKVVDDFAAVVDQIDVLIDFTRPDASMAFIELCRQAGKKIVIGTTGFSDAQKAVIAEAAKDVAG
ncbi:MAG: 4-hydroxy-tetrahydrodipicolinate reductase, partial [Methylococcaceae bacterium]